MGDFLTSYRKTAISEGGYANDPKDHGGETWRGISRNNFPRWEGWVRIDSYKKLSGFPAMLKNDGDLELLVLKFYRKNFWNVIRGDEIKAQPICDQVYDMAVNAGNGTAIMLAQNDAFGLPTDADEKNKKIHALGIDYGTMDNKTLSKLNNAA